MIGRGFWAAKLKPIAISAAAISITKSYRVRLTTEATHLPWCERNLQQ